MTEWLLRQTIPVSKGVSSDTVPFEVAEAIVETVDQIVFEQAAPFFRDSLNPRGATFAVRPVIEQIVAGRTPELAGNQSRFLMRRGLIPADGMLAFPILGRWLNESSE